MSCAATAPLTLNGVLAEFGTMSQIGWRKRLRFNVPFFRILFFVPFRYRSMRNPEQPRDANGCDLQSWCNSKTVQPVHRALRKHLVEKSAIFGKIGFCTEMYRFASTMRSNPAASRAQWKRQSRARPLSFAFHPRIVTSRSINCKLSKNGKRQEPLR